MAKHEYIHAALICANLSFSVVINIHVKYHIQDMSLSNILQYDEFCIVPRLLTLVSKHIVIFACINISKTQKIFT